MYEVKNRIYGKLNRVQKTGLCNFLRALVKQNMDLSIDEIYDKFVEDERYYEELNVSKFEFLADMIDDEQFCSDTKLYIRECKRYYEYKQAQAPIIAANKEFEKKKRKFLQDVKMSKEKPTKKQLYYYEKLCKRYNEEGIDTETASRLDLRNEIERILDEHSGDYKNINGCRD